LLRSQLTINAARPYSSAGLLSWAAQLLWGLCMSVHGGRFTSSAQHHQHAARLSRSLQAGSLAALHGTGMPMRMVRMPRALPGPSLRCAAARGGACGRRKQGEKEKSPVGQGYLFLRCQHDGRLGAVSLHVHVCGGCSKGSFSHTHARSHTTHVHTRR